MSVANRDSYFEQRVLTASPHRLHLLLIEGAIRLGKRAEQSLQRGDRAEAAAPLARVLEIVGEMVAGVRRVKSDLNEQIEGLYLYLFRRVAEAKINDDVAKLAEAIRLLEFERETWQLACDQAASQSPEGAPQSPASKPATPRPRALARYLSSQLSAPAGSGISLEA
jgi:flagellar protein FliS